MNTIPADTTTDAVRNQFETLRRIWHVITDMREIIMWLPKNERNVLSYLYKNLGRDAIAGTVKLQLEDFARCCFDEDRAVEAARFLAERGLLKLDTINHPSGYIKLGFTSGGYDLGKKYSSQLHTLLLLCDEYKVWIILGLMIGLAGIIISILVAIFKD